jgi:hypothetical protein
MPTKSEKSDFDAQKETFIKRQKTFHIHKKRGTETMHMSDNMVAMYKSSKRKKDKSLNKEIINLIANVAKNVNSFIRKSNCQFEIEEERHSSTWTNRDLYDELDEGEIFYYIDVKHCFWRIAFLKGYISKRMYESILDKPHLKTYRNMALACIIAPASREYYVRGRHVITIEEDKTLHRLIYDNIRFTAYNLMGDIAAVIGDAYVIGYRTDGILVLPDMKDEVVSLIEEQDYMCEVKKIIKIDDEFYRYEDGTRKHL